MLRLPGALRYLLIGSLCLFFVVSALRWAINEPRLYHWGFSRNQVPAQTNLEQDELRRLAASLIAYFNSPEEPFVFIGSDGLGKELFNPRELTHLQDVKGLVRLVFHLQEGTAILIAALFLALALAQRQEALTTIARALLHAGILAAATVLVFGAAVLLCFEHLFLLFHQLSFRNDLWILDPRTDLLIWIFPPDFFFDAALVVALVILAQAILAGAIGAAWLRWLQSRPSRGAAAIPRSR